MQQAVSVTYKKHTYEYDVEDTPLRARLRDGCDAMLEKNACSVPNRFSVWYI
jgi:hypothetical protein